MVACREPGVPTRASPPPAQQLTLTSASPPSGAVVTTQECPSLETPAVCSREIDLEFSVIYDATVSDARVFVEFYTASEQRCAVTVTRQFTLQPGALTTLRTDVVLLSAPPEPQFCELPATTTRIVATLMEGSRTRLLMREFQQTYTFMP